MRSFFDKSLSRRFSSALSESSPSRRSCRAARRARPGPTQRRRLGGGDGAAPRALDDRSVVPAAHDAVARGWALRRGADACRRSAPAGIHGYAASSTIDGRRWPRWRARSHRRAGVARRAMPTSRSTSMPTNTRRAPTPGCRRRTARWGARRRTRPARRAAAGGARLREVEQGPDEPGSTMTAARKIANLVRPTCASSRPPMNQKKSNREDDPDRLRERWRSAT